MEKINKIYLISGFITSIIISVCMLAYAENTLFRYVDFNVIFDVLLSDFQVYLAIALGTYFFPLQIITFVKLFKDDNTLKFLKNEALVFIGIMAALLLPMKAMLDLALDLPKVDNTISCKYEQKNSQNLITCSNGYIYHLSENLEEKIEKVEVKETLNYLIKP